MNWVAVFEEEYSLPPEVVETLRNRIEKVSVALENLSDDTIYKRVMRPVLRVASAVDDGWSNQEEFSADVEELDEGNPAILEQELFDDEISSEEEGFVRGYWREQKKKLNAQD